MIENEENKESAPVWYIGDRQRCIEAFRGANVEMYTGCLLK